MSKYTPKSTKRKVKKAKFDCKRTFNTIATCKDQIWENIFWFW